MKKTTLIKRFKPYIQPFTKELFLGFFCGILGGGTSVLTTFYLGKSVDVMIGKNQVDFPHLFSLLLLLGIVMLISVITQYFTQFFANALAYGSVNRLRKDALTHLDKLPLSYFMTLSKGDLLSRFTNDMDNISTGVTAIFAQLFQGVTTILLALIFMSYLSLPLTLVVLLTTPLIFATNYLVAKNSQKTFKAQQEILGELSGYAKEGIAQGKIVAAFQQEDTRQKHFEHLNQELYVKGQKAQFASSLTNPMARFVDHLAYLLIGLFAGILYLFYPNTMTVGILSSFTIYASQFSKPFIELSGLMTQLQTAQIGLSRSFKILDEKEENIFGNKTLPKPQGNISFSKVYFSYEKNQPLIKDFNLNVTSGEKIAIVGKTGAGKSTLVNLLMGFYPIDAGEITLDGKNIYQYQGEELRKSFGMVLQETWLFDGTIEENLMFGSEEATYEQMVEAAKKAHIHHFIDSLPDKYQTIIGQGGLTISNGQRQLLTIARMMLKNPPMLILDEATSSVDTLTELQIQDGFNQMMLGKTSFIIAHRLSTIKNADKILVLDHGAIVEQGNHDTLLGKKGAYYHLYEAQFNQ